MADLIRHAEAARTVADVVALEKALERELGGARVRHLGDRQSNWSAVSSAVAAQSIIFERVTNMWDALIEERADQVRESRRNWQSPAEAAEALLGVPAEGPPAMAQKELEALAGRCLIRVLDSDDPVKRPTLGFRDYGIGLTAEEMPKTILSLEESNKLHKPYLHGVFGKGGSVTCMFSSATIIVTRKQPHLLNGGPDRVSIAVVREGDSPDARLPFFRYLVRPQDGLPYSVDATEIDFAPGTLVLHVDYQADRLGQQNWTYEESIYAYAETVLFRPTLPYQLADARTGSANVRPENRRAPSRLMGLGQRLDRTKPNKDGLLDKSLLSRVPVPGLGEVGVRWWLLENEDRRRKRAAKGFVTLFVTGGQVHHYWDTARFSTHVEGRKRVAKRIIAEVDCSQLDQQDKVRIFSSFRDAFLSTPQAGALERSVAEWLANDQDLDDAESQLTLQALASSTGSVSAAFRERLNRAVKAKIPGLGGGGHRPDARRNRPPKPHEAEELFEEPTTFTGRERIEILPGQRKTFYMQCNAVDGFVPERGTVNIIAGVGSPPFQFGVGDLRRGRLQLSLFVAAESSLGTSQLEIVLVWQRADGQRAELRWPLEVRVVAEPTIPKPPSNGKPKKRTPRGGMAFLWMDAERQKEWNDQVVGELQPIKGKDLAELEPDTYADLRNVEEEIPTVVLNKGFRDLDAYLRGIVKDASDEALASRRDRYALAVGVTVANLGAQEEKLTRAFKRWEEGGSTGAPPDPPLTEEQMRRALVQTARGVVALLPDFEVLFGDDGAGDAIVESSLAAGT